MERSGTSRGRSLVIAVLALWSGPAGARAQVPVQPVEAHYGAVGPCAVAHSQFVDGAAVRFEVLRPATCTDGSIGPFPLLTWGNGSLETPATYAPMLEHLASWGFVVVASVTTEAGTGDELLDGVARALVASADPTSPLADLVDPTRVGAFGHSQGAGGTVRAASLAPDLIDTTITVALPTPLFITPFKRNEFDVAGLTHPALFLTGTEDALISSVELNRSYADRSNGPSALAVLTGADHLRIQHEAVGYLPYVTAWMRWQLHGDRFAGTAFAGPAPELAAHPSWRELRTKGLELPAGPEVAEDDTGGPSPSSTVPGGAVLPATGRAVPIGLAVVALAAGLLLRRTVDGAAPRG